MRRVRMVGVHTPAQVPLQIMQSVTHLPVAGRLTTLITLPRPHVRQKAEADPAAQLRLRSVVGALMPAQHLHPDSPPPRFLPCGRPCGFPEISGEEAIVGPVPTSLFSST